MTHNSKKLNHTLLFAFLMVASLFFIWGFCHAMLDVLNKHFQNILHVSKAQSGFIQTSVFGAYFLLAFPSALLIRRIGYQKGILLGLMVVATGAFLFIPAGLWFKTFWSFLYALFVLSSGLACIETAANPYVTVLGPKDGAAARLSVAQAFNSVAYIIAPTVGGALIFGKRHQAGAPVDFSGLLIPYVVLGCVVLVVFGVFSFIKLPSIDDDAANSDAGALESFVHTAPLNRQPHFVWGIVTQFLYIAAQVGVNAFAVNYILENVVAKDASGAAVTDALFSWYGSVTGAASPEATAAYVITIAMILYAAGRFSGAAITKVVKPNLLLSLYGIANCIIILIVMADIKHVSWLVLPFCWLFMSIMFPFIFAMSLRNLGEKTKLAASFQIMSIVGGAVAPPLMGWLADRYHSMAICFILPLIGFIAPTVYGFAYPKLLEKSRLAGATA
ncbi:MAG: sugar MFS transporter [Verrucomicrobia bacterium]|jgi:FHS family L-fucose permease-like MFS transporter|nr:sugar MFS transporter [Verrucomicrobiota bacterium]OQC65721.1 MAG: L-fucose-proton symporter [Verrucomicrobia bacterium ADurb.Bin006]MDI9381181.1 sugar MFS transporter [Verrucomicrobiota bacterium]NMD19090.1 sugar MFS transporter [Verrucomicrobiota bacterium]HOA61730.1 sugar MFS transporter [Verrucomicrobiota bacterium]